MSRRAISISGTAKPDALFSTVSSEKIIWVEVVPTSSPTLRRYQTRPVTSSRIRRTRKSSTSMGFVLQQGSSSVAFTICSALHHTDRGSTPACASVSRKVSSRRSRHKAVFQVPHGDGVGTAADSAALASSAYFFDATWALQVITEAAEWRSAAHGERGTAAQTMRHGVAQPQPCLGEGNARHGRRLMHLQPHVLPPRIGAGRRQRRC